MGLRESNRCITTHGKKGTGLGACSGWFKSVPAINRYPDWASLWFVGKQNARKTVVLHQEMAITVLGVEDG